MKEHFDRLEAKIDKIAEDVSVIKTTIAKQEVNIEYHIKRTDALEERVLPVSDWYNWAKAMLKTIAYWAGILAALATATEAVIMVLKYLKGAP